MAFPSNFSPNFGTLPFGLQAEGEFAYSPFNSLSGSSHRFGVCAAPRREILSTMPYDQALADRVTDALTARRVSFHVKNMFGGLCFMVNDKMCLGILDTRLMVRLDPAEETAALKRKGCKPMDFTGRPMKGYVFVDTAGHETEAQLKHWLDLALAFNPKAKASKKRAG